MKSRLRVLVCVAWIALILAMSATAFGATLCVKQGGGGGGCYSTITAAIAHASPGDTIKVHPGIYAEDVVVNISLSLIGSGSENTIINAFGLANGINIDGHNNPGLKQVSVKGFAVKNANFQGILVTDASDVTIAENYVSGNDRLLQPFASGGPVCPGLPPYFVAGEGFDCGEGIHFSGVTFSQIVNNVVRHNAGGILISDDTGPNHDNLISGNTVSDNPFDCGITIASHHFALSPQDPAVGIQHITVVGNQSLRNGLATGEGAGVGIFAGPPGAQNNGNVIADNLVSGNALPGVALHSHSPFQSLNGHLIVGNIIVGNGPDSDPGTTVPTGISVFSDTGAGAPPIKNLVITQNTFKRESIDIAVSTDGNVIAHLNNLFGDIGVDNLTSATIDATLNWWGCHGGPGAPGCSTATGPNISVAPWLYEPFHSLDSDDGKHDH